MSLIYGLNLPASPLVLVQEAKDQEEKDDQEAQDQQVAQERLLQSQNWVMFQERRATFSGIQDCFCDQNGSLFFHLQFDDFDLVYGLMEQIAIPARALAHNKEALKWAEQWSKFWIRFGGIDTQIGGLYTFEELDTSATLEKDLVDWIILNSFRPFTCYFEENWFTSLSMVKHIHEDMLKNWGIKETPARMIMKHIRELP